MSVLPPPAPTPPPGTSLPTAADAAWRAAQAGAIVVEVPALGLLSASGPDAAAFLHGQLSTNVNALQTGQGHWSTYNSPKGRMLATLYLYRPPGAPEDRFEALLAADLAGSVRKRLAMFVLRSKVTLADETAAWALLGVGGPGACAAVREALGLEPAPGCVAGRDDVRAVHLPDGRIVVVAPADAAASVRRRLAAAATPAPEDVWTWLGVRAAVPMVTAATQDQFVAQTANLDALGGLDFRKGCYPGQEIVARTQYLGRLKERLHLFEVDGPPPAPGARLYAPVFGEQPCGTVVNSARRPEGGSLAIAVLQTAAADGPVRLDAPDGAKLRILPLPYALPEPAAPRGRVKL